jgi:hypothetical protein
LAENYKKTAAQIALRWGIQRNTAHSYKCLLTTKRKQVRTLFQRRHNMNSNLMPAQVLFFSRQHNMNSNLMLARVLFFIFYSNDASTLLLRGKISSKTLLVKSFSFVFRNQQYKIQVGVKYKKIISVSQSHAKNQV